MRQKALALNVAEQVIFLGFQEAIPEFLRDSDLFVLPSRNEAMPISILEALATGLPCVVTQVGENGDLVEYGRQGFVIPANSPSALAEALLRLLENPQLIQQLSQQALAKSAQYSLQRMIERTEGVYGELLK